MQHASGLHSLLMLSNSVFFFFFCNSVLCVTPRRVYLLVCWWALRLLPPFGSWERYCSEHGCTHSWPSSCFQFFGVPSNSRIAGSYSNSIFNFLRNCLIQFWGRMFPKRRRRSRRWKRNHTQASQPRSEEVFCTDYVFFPFLSSIPSVILLVNLQKETLRKTECGVFFFKASLFFRSTDKVRFSRTWNCILKPCLIPKPK